MPNRNSLSGKILKTILYGGAIAIAATSPFAYKVAPEIISYIAKGLKTKNKSKQQDKQYYNAFYYLSRQGFVQSSYKNGQMHISLTPEGKVAAKKYQIDDLRIRKPKSWNSRWWVLIFDITEKHKIKREALRGKLKDLGLYKLQFSVWVSPYDFKEEIFMLRDFFGLNQNEMQVIEASFIENDAKIRKYFGLA